jgi:hypothetical protein
MITDEDLVPFEFSDFWEEPAMMAQAAPSSHGIDPDYISRHISRIPQYGDNSRWRLADYLNMFDNLSRDGTLTPEQREAVDNFAAGYQSDEFESDDCTCQDSGWQSSLAEDYRYELDDDAPIRGDGRGRLTDEMNFPECQYIANGVDPATAHRLGTAYRVGNFIKPIGHPAADRISNRLNTMQNRRTALRK